jgi:hypothetical protein
MSNPRIAIINLKHPDLTVPHKVHHARDIIKRLQERGEMPWTKYKGACEWLVWGNVPSTAILHISELTELDNLVEQSEDVNNLLQLHMFSSNARTRTIAQRLQNRNCTLNIDAAKAMGQIAELFGLGSVNATPDHIKEFVANLVDGWSIKPTSVNDIRSLDFLALHFTTTLNPRGSYRLHDVIEAFVQGVLKGSENLAHFGRGRRNNLTHSNNLR